LFENHFSLLVFGIFKSGKEPFLTHDFMPEKRGGFSGLAKTEGRGDHPGLQSIHFFFAIMILFL
jgi:hypothetical protein